MSKKKKRISDQLRGVCAIFAARKKKSIRGYKMVDESGIAYSVRRQNAFEHLIRIFRFLVIQFRCGKRQDTISDKHGIHNTRLTRHNRSLPDLPTDDGVERRNVLKSIPSIPPDLYYQSNRIYCVVCVVYTTFVGNNVLSFTTSKLNSLLCQWKGPTNFLPSVHVCCSAISFFFFEQFGLNPRPQIVF